MELSKAIISGSATAHSLVKTLLTNPIVYEEGKIKEAVILEVESYSQSGQADVGESLIITASAGSGDGSKKYVSDNVAPSSWTWYLQGYIAGNPILEPTNFYPWVVIRNRKKLLNFFRNGTVLKFKDIKWETFNNVVIESIDIQWENDCQNRSPFSMTLREINVVSAATASVSSVISKSTPDMEGKDGSGVDAGTTQTSKIDTSILYDNPTILQAAIKLTQ